MNKGITTIKGFSNYVVEITMGGLEYRIVDTRNNQSVDMTYNHRQQCSEYQLEDDSGDIQLVDGSILHQFIYPYLRDMNSYLTPSFQYPEIDLEGDIYCLFYGKWITDSERAAIEISEWKKTHQ